LAVALLGALVGACTSHEEDPARLWSGHAPRVRGAAEPYGVSTLPAPDEHIVRAFLAQPLTGETRQK
jgi:hypothetical protein